MKAFSLEKSHRLKLAFFDQQDGMIHMNRYKITFSMITETALGDSDSIDRAQFEQNVSFAKVNAFLTGVLDGSMVLSNEDDVDDVLMLLSAYQNNVIILPALHESILVSALHCKLNTIVSENTFVELVELANLDDDLSYKLFSDELDNEYLDLPAQNEWQGKWSYWNKPWWTRDDVCTLDRSAENQEEYDQWLEESTAANIDEVNRMMFTEIEKYAKMYAEGPKEGEVVEVDFSQHQPWKPEVV